MGPGSDSSIESNSAVHADPEPVRSDNDASTKWSEIDDSAPSKAHGEPSEGVTDAAEPAEDDSSRDDPIQVLTEAVDGQQSELSTVAKRIAAASATDRIESVSHEVVASNEEPVSQLDSLRDDIAGEPLDIDTALEDIRATQKRLESAGAETHSDD